MRLRVGRSVGAGLAQVRGAEAPEDPSAMSQYFACSSGRRTSGAAHSVLSIQEVGLGVSRGMLGIPTRRRPMWRRTQTTPLGFRTASRTWRSTSLRWRAFH